MHAIIIRSYRFIRSYDDDGLLSQARERAPILTGAEARQGVISGRVLLILMGSLSLAVMVGAMLLALHMISV